MTNINIVFEYDFNDVDIIAIPSEISYKIIELGQEFLDWHGPKDDPDYWGVENGRTYQIAETVGFVKWLNMFHCLNEKKAYIVTQHTDYNPEYLSLDF